MLEPVYVAYVMQKKAPDDGQMPRWLRYLKPVLSGMYTADNLDYVLRDAYMCGVAVGPVDLARLLHYSMFTEHGLTLHKAGIGALTMFLQARFISIPMSTSTVRHAPSICTCARFLRRPCATSSQAIRSTCSGAICASPTGPC